MNFSSETFTCNCSAPNFGTDDIVLVKLFPGFVDGLVETASTACVLSVKASSVALMYFLLKHRLKPQGIEPIVKSEGEKRMHFGLGRIRSFGLRLLHLDKLQSFQAGLGSAERDSLASMHWSEKLNFETIIPVVGFQAYLFCLLLLLVTKDSDFPQKQLIDLGFVILRSYVYELLSVSFVVAAAILLCRSWVFAEVEYLREALQEHKNRPVGREGQQALQKPTTVVTMPTICPPLEKAVVSQREVGFNPSKQVAAGVPARPALPPSYDATKSSTWQQWASQQQRKSRNRGEKAPAKLATSNMFAALADDDGEEKPKRKNRKN